jgi:hypothetical protein
VMLRLDFFTKEIRRLLHGGKWSQSPVLPRTRKAYETFLSAGSTAKMDPSPGNAPGSLPYRGSASLTML